MKRTIAIIAILGLSQFASADIPLPHNPAAQTESKSVTYSGKKAEAKYESIVGQEILGASSGWSGDVETYKVERSEDGLVQTVCSKQYNMRTHMAPIYSCTKETSTNEGVLPVFHPTPRMG